jgi:hypothetical protein
MKKIGAACLFLMLIVIILALAGCTKKSAGAADSTPEIKTEFVIGGETIKLEPLSLLSDKVSLLIPDSFRVMTKEEADQKYAVERRPTIIYTDESGTVNIALSYTKDKASEKEIKIQLETFKQTFKSVFPTAEWYDTGVTDINGKNAGYMELLTPGVDTETYNLMWFTELDGVLLISAFNCTKDQMEDWKPVAKTIMKSQQYFVNSNVVETPSHDTNTYKVGEYPIQVTFPAGWYQDESSDSDLACRSANDAVLMSIHCIHDSNLQEGVSRKDYIDNIIQHLIEKSDNVSLLEEETERQYTDKAISSVLYSMELEGTQVSFYVSLVSIKDSDYFLCVLVCALPSDFKANKHTIDAVFQTFQLIES